MARAKPLIRTGAVTTSQRLLPDRDFARTEYYNDFLKHLDLRHLIGVFLFAEPTRLSQVSVLRPRRRGPFDDSDERLLEAITPHLQRALRIHQRLTEIQLERDALGDALDRLPFGVIILGSEGRVLRVNRVAEDLLALRDGLSLTQAGLLASRSDETEALRQAVRSAVDGRHAERRGSSIMVSRPSLRRPFSVLVAPVGRESAPLGPSGAAGAIFITDPERRVDPPLRTWRRVFGFTSAEANLASRLADGFDLATAADDLQVTIGTARTHLKRILSKTGTHRQAELIRMLLAYGWLTEAR